METLLQDLRFSFRSLAKAPLFTTLCILCLAVGIGVNVNVYSAVYAAFLRPFGFSDADRLVVIQDRNATRGVETPVFSYQAYRDIEREARAFAAIAGSAYRSVNLTEGDEPVRLEGQAITANLFSLLGVTPHLGRLFRAEEDTPGTGGAIILGYEIWAQRYAADSGVIGRTISVNGTPHVVVGVMPPGFMFPERSRAWVPAAPLMHASARDVRELVLYGRLRDGVDVAAATAELDAISRRFEERHPQVHANWRAFAQPLREFFVPADTKLVITAMMGAVTFVLLIACANVANLMLARATTRAREIAVRSALGASRGRVVRQLLTESTLLALVACPLGIVIAYWLLDLVLASIPPNDMPYYIRFAIDGPVLLYAVLVAAGTGMVFGLAPAIQLATRDLQGSLKDGARGGGTGSARHRLRGALVVGEIALAVVLLVGASLFIRSFLTLKDNTGGVQTANVLTLRFFMPGTRYDSAAAITQRVHDVTGRIAALPGVVSVTASNQIPLSGEGSGGTLVIDGKPAEPGQEPFIEWTGATARWYSTLGIPLRAGRDFTPPEARDSSRVAIVNETMAARFWPGESPIGKRFRLADRPDDWFTIIGVSADYRTEELDDNVPVPPGFVVAYPWLPTRNTALMVRTQGDPASATAAVRAAIRDSDPALPVFEIQTLEELRRFGFWSVRLFGWMFAMFGVVALVLASVGVYGVIAYGVSQRTQEIGVRVALGAQASDVIGMVIRGGATLALTGIGIGLAGAFGVTRVVQSLLFGVSATDTLSFVGVALFLGAIALLASYVPARRATRVDPLTALRSE